MAPIELVGWIGDVVCLVSYLLLAVEYVTNKQYRYWVINFIGGACLTTNLYYYWNRPAFFLNVFYLGIALVGILTIAIKNRRNKRSV